MSAAFAWISEVSFCEDNGEGGLALYKITASYLRFRSSPIRLAMFIRASSITTLSLFRMIEMESGLSLTARWSHGATTESPELLTNSKSLSCEAWLTVPPRAKKEGVTGLDYFCPNRLRYWRCMLCHSQHLDHDLFPYLEATNNLRHVHVVYSTLFRPMATEFHTNTEHVYHEAPPATV